MKNNAWPEELLILDESTALSEDRSRHCEPLRGLLNDFQPVGDVYRIAWRGGGQSVVTGSVRVP
ncbi:hypothetical protein ABT324_06340 [Saccharopolyspora sp. NPDC000359]|uniref:hypothetical protein n=1 Tax=Saccharopolyspora sp. NPDC000359 TaxID=3154251 RepID=UPI00332761F4